MIGEKKKYTLYWANSANHNFEYILCVLFWFTQSHRGGFKTITDSEKFWLSASSLKHQGVRRGNKRWMSELFTHQQPGGDGDDVGHRVFSGDVLAGFGDVAEDIAVDDSAEDEVDMANQDER